MGWPGGGTGEGELEGGREREVRKSWVSDLGNFGEQESCCTVVAGPLVRSWEHVWMNVAPNTRMVAVLGNF